MDTLLTFLVRSTARIFQILPESAGIAFFTLTLKLTARVSPKHKKIALQNLSLAFPDKDQATKQKILEASYRELARLITVSLRLPRYSKEWIASHVEFPRKDEWDKLNRERENQGFLIATGHLGCFELLAHSIALYGHPISYIVRNFKAEKLDTWWKSIRESTGNTVINRKGAYKETVRTLRKGRNVGILFDQNVTRNHAIFVDFFGTPAATSKALALAALQVKSILIVATIRNLPEGKYRIEWEKCDVDDIYSSSLSRDEKVFEITKRASLILEKRVRDYPEGWFWMHRRWKTRPTEGDEAIY